MYEKGGILVFETWTVEDAHVKRSTVHQWNASGQALQFHSGVINTFAWGFHRCEEFIAHEILEELAEARAQEEMA